MDTASAIKMIVNIAGGLGIFLLGMKNMSEGMQAVAGNRMRKLINAVTNNRIIACGVGVIVTSLIQSSSVTTVMVVGMVNLGLNLPFPSHHNRLRHLLLCPPPIPRRNHLIRRPKPAPSGLGGPLQLSILN